MYNITYNNSFAYVWGLRLQIVDDPYIWVNAGNNSSLFLCLLIIEARKTHERGNSAHHDVRSNLVVLLALISGCELCRLERAGCGIWPIVIIRPILTVPFATNISVIIFSVYIYFHRSNAVMYQLQRILIYDTQFCKWQINIWHVFFSASLGGCHEV